MKFNFLNRQAKPAQTVNYEGEKAFVMTPELELYAAVATAGLSDKFYESGAEQLERIRALIEKNDPVFVAQLAVYARESMYLRSIPMVLAVELAKRHRGDGLVGRTVARIVQRADEITELLAYYALSNERTGAKKLGGLSKQVQKGLAEAFNRFDAYQFAKYNRDGSAVKLRDALFLTHPLAKDAAQQAIFDQIVTGTLETPYTWETELSTLGQQSFGSEKMKKDAFRAKWEELIDSGNLGYMALMRNLRNILEAEVSGDHITKICNTLSDPKQVSRSKQLPFRFLAAYREVLVVPSGHTAQVLTALEGAVVAAAANVQGFSAKTRVVIACDVSGSMQKPVSKNSKILLYDIGLMLGMLLKSRCQNVISGMFGNTWKIINLPMTGILANVQEFYRREGEVGYATNGYLVVKDLIDRCVVVDKVMIFTDCQLWNNAGNDSIESLWKRYRKNVAPDAKLYLFDLAGYSKSPLDLSKGNGVHLVAGWSDKIFDVMSAIESGQSAVETIQRIEI